MPRWLNEGHIGYILGHYYFYPVGSKIKKKRYRPLSVSVLNVIVSSDNSHCGKYYNIHFFSYIFNTIHYGGNIINYKYIVNTLFTMGEILYIHF